MRERNVPNRVGLLADAGLEPVDLGEQYRAGITRIAGADEFLDRAGDARVHHLERGGQHARGDRAAHRRRRIIDRIERAEERCDGGRLRHEANRNARRDAHRPFGADEAAP